MFFFGGGPQKKKCDVKKTYQELILNVGLNIDMYTVYCMLNRALN